MSQVDEPIRAAIGGILDRVEIRATGSSSYSEGHVIARLDRLRGDPPPEMSAEQVAEEIAYLEALHARKFGGG